MAEETAQPVVSDQAQAVAPPVGDTEGTAAVEQPQQQTDPGAGAADETPAVELSQEQKASWDAWTPEQKRHFNKVMTPKFQELAAERKKLGYIAQLAEALEARPDEVIEGLARARGFQVARPQPNVQEQTAKAQEQADLEAQFGPEAAQIIMKRAEAIAEKVVEARIKPLAEHHSQTIQERERADAAAALQSLTEKFPDWKTHEAAMSQLAQKLQPGPGMTKAEYAELLYLGVNRNRTSAQQTKAVIDQLNKAAKAAEAPAQPVPSNRVAPSRPKDLSFDKQILAAAQAAARGEVWGE